MLACQAVESALVDDNFGFALRRGRELILQGHVLLADHWLTFYQVAKHSLPLWSRTKLEEVIPQQLLLLGEVLAMQLSAEAQTTTVDLWQTKDRLYSELVGQGEVLLPREHEPVPLAREATEKARDATEKARDLLTTGLGWALGATPE